MGTQSYVVTYDICDPKRLREVYECMRSWGAHIQYSVFRCELTEVGLARLRSELHPLIDHSVDQILFFDLGPSDGRAQSAATYLGVPYSPRKRTVEIV